MFYDAPPDIPPAIVKYVKNTYKKPPEAMGRWFKYLTGWEGKELYATNWRYSEPLKTGPPTILVYDCHDVRKASISELHNINKNNIIPKYLPLYTKEEHLCHRNKKAFNQHTRPEDYNIKVEHINYKYIPKAVVEYVDSRYPDSRYPGTDKRIINYITTWNGYEAYVVYWKSKKYRRRSGGRPMLYDGKKVRRPDIKEWKNIMSNVSNIYRSHGQPYLYNKD